MIESILACVCFGVSIVCAVMCVRLHQEEEKDKMMRYKAL